MSGKQTITEITESLTGFEEIAIEKQTGKDLLEMQRTPSRMIRALVAVDFSRNEDGLGYPEAFKRAQGLTMKEVMDYFADDEEVDAEDPITESGKEPALFD